MSPRPWLFLEPYHGGSHRHLADGLAARLPLEVWTLPARKWKWRMRGAALDLAERFARETPDPAGIVCTSLANAADLRGLLPPAARTLPLVVYFHENQLAYPVQHFDVRDHHFAWTNLTSALAADVVLWNSAWNRDSFLDGMETLLRKMPDARPDHALPRIRERSRIFPVPLDVDALAARPDRRTGPCHIVWNHRWEFDKDPDLLLACVEALVAAGVDYRMSLLGQRFDEVPEAFVRIREIAGDRLVRHEPLEDRDAYLDHLTTADVVLSTARHEFQGLAILEGAACGAVPLVPDALAYRELWPQDYRVERAQLPAALVERAREVARWRREDPRPHCRALDWSRQVPRWEALFAELA